MNKRTKSEELYAALVEEGYVLPEGKSLRGVFIDRATTEFGMTSKGAATYYVNAKKRHEGGTVANYYKPKTEKPPAIGMTAPVGDGRWSVVLIDDGAVLACYTHPTEEKARSEYNALRPGNKARCVVVPGVMQVGEPVSSVTAEHSELVAANPDDLVEE